MDWAMKEKGYTQRRACALVGMAPKVYRYQSNRSDDGALRRRLRELASQRRRFGYGGAGNAGNAGDADEEPALPEFLRRK